MKQKLFILALALLPGYKAFAQTQIAAADAARHIGETVKLCDIVYGTKLISGSNTTLLNLGGYYPNQLLTIMIGGKDRSKFKGAPEEDFEGRSVCVTGKIVEFKGKPEIIVNDPSQLKLEGADIVQPVSPNKF